MRLIQQKDEKGYNIQRENLSIWVAICLPPSAEAKDIQQIKEANEQTISLLLFGRRHGLPLLPIW